MICYDMLWYVKYRDVFVHTHIFDMIMLLLLSFVQYLPLVLNPWYHPRCFIYRGPADGAKAAGRGFEIQIILAIIIIIIIIISIIIIVIIIVNNIVYHHYY